MLPDNVLYYGKEEPLPEQRRLRAGPLTVLYEEGDLRYIRLGNAEIVRRIYVAVRDRNWGTVAPALSNVRVETGPASFRISYEVRNRQDEIDFIWTGQITGDEQGTIRFSMEGEARSNFLRNRIGFCVLHPMRECQGRLCQVEKPDGAVERGEFPRFISPHQPFKEMRAISHEVAPGVRAEVRFEGDVFEMEDQRNWTDASYKTYCTPLERPYPVQIRRGDRISQSVTLTLNGAVPNQPPAADAAAVTFSRTGAPPVALPRIGLGVASHGQPLSARELDRLRALHLSHLRVDLRPDQPSKMPEALRRANDEGSALGVPLEVALHLSDAASAELDSLMRLLEQVRPRVCHWLVFHVGEKSTSERWVRLAREHLARYDPRARIGAGTNAYFTELNRERPPINALEVVAYSVNPQVHAFDNASLVETWEGQSATVESGRHLTGSVPLAVTPVTLRPRFNPNATGPEREPAPDELPEPVDVRQMSLFGAGWTAGSIGYLSDSGAASLTYYETTGWRGVMETEAGSPKPQLFRSLPGGVFPLYHVLADVGEFAGGEVVPTGSTDPLRVDGLLLQKDGRTRLILANVTPQSRSVNVSGWTAPAGMRRLDRTTAEDAIRAPKVFRSRQETIAPSEAGELKLDLMPYSVVCLDQVEGGRAVKIAVVGAGAMGSVFGARLARSGEDVTLVDVWREGVDAVNARGLRVDEKSGGTETVRLHATTEPASVGEVDLALVFVKCYHTEAAIQGAAPLIGPETTVLSLQNGWGNAPRIAAIIGEERVLVGVTYHSATLAGPGHVQHTGHGMTFIGELNGSMSARVERVAEAFHRAGIEVTPTITVLKEIWSKLALNVCTLPASALLRFTADQMVQHQGTLELMRGLLGEAVAVANAQGIGLDFDERWETITGLLKRAVGGKSSMLQDVQNRRRTEIDVVNGAIVADGDRLGIPTPHNATMVWLIRSLEETFASAQG